MIKLFPQSLKFMLISSLLTVVGAVVAAVANSDPTVSVVILFLGGWIVWVGTQYQAINGHQQYLKILYNDMDPDRFIEEYSKLLPKVKRSSKLGAAMWAHIGNAYVAKGEFEKALPYFENENKDLATKIMLTQNRCTTYLYMEDSENAQRELDNLEALMNQIKPRKRVPYEYTDRMLHTWLDFLKGSIKNEDIQWLRTESAKTNKPLHRCTTRLLMARIHRKRGERGLAKDMAQAVVDEGGKIWAVEEAKKLL